MFFVLAYSLIDLVDDEQQHSTNINLKNPPNSILPNFADLTTTNQNYL